MAHRSQPLLVMYEVTASASGYLRRILSLLTLRAIGRLSDFARRLGTPALVTVPVSAAMLSPVPVVTPQQPLEEVAQLLVGGRNAELAVVDHGEPIGVITRADVALGLEQRGRSAVIADAPLHGVVTVSPSDSLAAVLAQLRGAPERVVVVVDRGEPVGLLTFDKLMAYVRAG